MSVGDLAVLRDRDYVLGVAWIDSIEQWQGEKDRYRCPNCTSTKFKKRSTRTPPYRCGACEVEFESPTVEHLTGTDSFRAEYQRTWQPLDVAMPWSAIDSAYLAGAKQHAIRELDLAAVRVLIDQQQPLGELWWSAAKGMKTELPGGVYGVLGKARIGQQRFREEMLVRFGESCAISGTQPAAALDAAHVYRYADDPRHDLDGGLLLRRDLHALFDRYELLIDPDDGWRVWVRPSLHVYPDIWRFNGITLCVPSSARPRADYLRIHAAAASEKWSQQAEHPIPSTKPQLG